MLFYRKTSKKIRSYFRSKTSSCWRIGPRTFFIKMKRLIAEPPGKMNCLCLSLQHSASDISRAFLMRLTVDRAYCPTVLGCLESPPPRGGSAYPVYRRWVGRSELFNFKRYNKSKCSGDQGNEHLEHRLEGWCQDRGASRLASGPLGSGMKDAM